MKNINVAAERHYSVNLVLDWRQALVEIAGDREVLVCAPKSLENSIRNMPERYNYLFLPDGEEQKSGDNFIRTLEHIADMRFPRSGILVGIGGGATTDLVGFLAASYLRGVDWIAIPTSLAGMVDAAIGGKTGINLSVGKNLAGAFYSPLSVIIDETFLSTLSDRDLRAGMAEVAKCGFIRDPKILTLITDGWRGNLSELIYRSIAVKADVVSQDFRESFQREILNYGHTLGHAVERDSRYSLRHGECVAIGLMYAAELSHRFSGLSSVQLELHREVLRSLDLPMHYERDAWPRLYEFMQSDKKKKDSLRFVTLSAIGEPTRLDNVSESQLKNAYQEVIGR